MVKNNLLYRLKGHGPRCGFFCMFASVCQYLYNKNQKNKSYIWWSDSRYERSEKNTLDLIFTQNYPKNYDAIITQGITMFSPTVKKYFVSKPHLNPQNIAEFNEKFWDTFSPNEELCTILEGLCNIRDGKKTLSVHIRRSDILSEEYYKHYLKFDVNVLENYFIKISEVFNKGGYEKIFLCTEDETVLNFLKSKFDSDIFFYQPNVKRVEYEIIDHRSSMESIYEEDGKKILLNLMSDVLFASYCDGFLGCDFSGVSIFIEIFNNNKFEEINYF